MANTTVHDIIEQAFQLIGVAQSGEKIPAEDAATALTTLNMMIGMWNSERLMVNGWTDATHSLTVGDAVYTIGPSGADITAARPFKIERAFVRYNAGSMAYDYQLEIVPVGKYQEVFLKGMTTTYPCYLWYNPTFPNGTITLYPVPSQACELHVVSYAQISEFAALTTSINLAPGYDMALVNNLALKLCLKFGKQPQALLVTEAAESKAAVMRANSEMSYLKCDSALLQRKVFNIVAGAYV